MTTGWTTADDDRVLAAVAAAWPELRAPDATFIDHLHSREPPLSPNVDPTRLAELYLAYLCGCGDEDAIAKLEHKYRAAIGTSLARVGTTRHAPADLLQILRQHLFVGPKPAIQSYNGSGSLAAWLGVVTLRTALNATRGRTGTSSSSAGDVAEQLADIEDPELDYLRDKYRADFRVAFDRAVADLSPRDRSLLRQHMVEKLTVRELGRIYGVNSGTVSRWIVRARDGLADRVCAQLKDQLDVDSDELESIMGMIRSRVALSITRALGG